MHGCGRLTAGLRGRAEWRSRRSSFVATPMQSLFWRSDKHEIDFVRNGKPWIEVKAGRKSPFEFDWFARGFPRENFLLDEGM